MQSQAILPDNKEHKNESDTKLLHLIDDQINDTKLWHDDYSAWGQLLQTIDELVDSAENLNNLIVVKIKGDKFINSVIHNLASYKIELPLLALAVLKFNILLCDLQESDNEEFVQKRNDTQKKIVSVLKKMFSKIGKLNVGMTHPIFTLILPNYNQPKTHTEFLQSLIKLFVNAGVDIKAEQENIFGEITTGLELATIRAVPKVVSVLLPYYDAKDATRLLTTFHLTTSYCEHSILQQAETVSLLLQHGADINFTREEVHYHIDEDSEETVKTIKPITLYEKTLEFISRYSFTSSITASETDVLLGIFEQLKTTGNISNLHEKILPLVVKILEKDGVLPEPIVRVVLNNYGFYFTHPEYKVKLLHTIVNCNHHKELLFSIVKSVSLTDIPLNDLCNLFQAAVNSNNHDLINRIKKLQPNILALMSPELRITLFMTAITKEHYVMADEVCLHSFDYNLALAHLFYESTVAKSKTTFHFMQILLNKGADILQDRRQLIIEKIAEYGWLDKLYVENKEEQLVLEKYLARNLLFNNNTNVDKNIIQLFEKYNLISKRFVDFYESNKGRKQQDSFMEFIGYPEYVSEIFFNKNLLAVLNDIPTPLLLRFANELMLNDKIRPHFIDIFTRLKSIEFFDGGSSNDTWWQLPKALIDRMSAPKSKLDASLKFEETCETIDGATTITDLQADKWKFHRVLGRTVILENKDGDLLAIKIKKTNEDIAELVKEYTTVATYQREAKSLDLQSQLPSPVMICKIDDAIEWIRYFINPDLHEKFKEMIGDTASHAAYIYRVSKANKNYFTYLHDLKLSDEEFAIANQRSMTDLCKLLANKIVYSQLADMFHNNAQGNARDDKGRYIVLSNLLSAQGVLFPAGSGRLTGWIAATQYVNERGSGLADFGDRLDLSAYAATGLHASTYFSSAAKAYKEKVFNYLLANIFAEYQYVPFLVAGRRAREKANSLEEKTPEKVQLIWQKSAMQIIDNCTTMLECLTSHSHAAAKKILSYIKAELSASVQMQYFMTNQYFGDIQNNIIRDGIYDSDTRVTVNFKKIRRNTFNLTNGMSINGVDPDLGTVNGQEPIKAINKLLYWMITIIVTDFLNYQLNRENTFKILQDKNPEQAFESCADSFKHLPKEQYHRQQYRVGLFAICKQLKQPVFNGVAVHGLWNKTKNAREDYLAAKYSHRWRQNISA